MRCYIRNEWYEIAEGAVFVENYNETLDSGTISVPQLSEKMDIEPLDPILVVFEEGIEVRRYCVDSYICKQTSLNPPRYDYEISLVSETKLLEGIICPNLAITKLADGTRSVYDYIKQYVDEYSPKTGSDPLNGATANKFRLGASLDKFKNIECPEMQWNQPTLREVLNDLMMVDDSIAALNSDYIGCLDISVTQDEISDNTKAGINYIQESHSSEDYVSDVKMHLVNAANNSIPTGDYSDIEDPDLPPDTTRIVERIGFRNNDSYLLTTENMRLQTSFPIWKLFFCKMYTFVEWMTFYIFNGVTRTQVRLENVDVGSIILKDGSTDYILEYSEWLTKDVLYGAWDPTTIGLSTDYRNTCLYYTRGGKNIWNFSDSVRTQVLWIGYTTYVFDMIARVANVEAAAREYALAYVAELNEGVDPGSPYYWIYDETTLEGAFNISYKNVSFEVAYEAIDDCVFSASKSPIPRNHRQIVDNQTNSYVDTNRQGMLEYLKANRLGNKISLINARYTHYYEAPRLSQKVNGQIIFRRELSVYNSHTDVNLTASENYVLRDYFTGVKSKIRSWRVVSGSEALTRAELIKFYINSNIPSVSNVNRIIPNYPDLDTYLENFKFCAIRFNRRPNEETYEYPGDVPYAGTYYGTNAIMVEFTKHKVGKSVIFTLNMGDNRYAGNYISNLESSQPSDSSTKWAEQKGVNYTDENGEITDGLICFYDQCDPLGLPSAAASRALKPLVDAGCITDDDGGLILNASNMVAKIPFKIHKDNKEILQISIQFEYNESANDMFLGYKEP